MFKMTNTMRLGTILLLLFFSINIELFSQDTHGTHETWEYVLEGTGDVLQIAIPVSAAALSLIEKDYEGTKQLAFSYATTLALSYTLKKVTHKKRPEGRLRYDSFPSAHTSSAFSGASFIQRRYGWKYGLPAYILAGLVGVSRMEGPDGYHDIWDVLGGAAVGIGCTYLFTKPYSEQQIELSFSSNESYKVISLKYSF